MLGSLAGVGGMRRGNLLFAFFKSEQLHDQERKQKLDTAI